MKTIRIISIACLILISFNSFSAIHVINQSGMYFLPANPTVNVGDVIHWVWADGSHTTSSRTIPVGATAWDAPLNSTHTSFDYTVTVAGSYSYACNYHESMGMVGSFTAVVATGINEIPLLQGFLIYPNPASTFMKISTELNGDIVLSDVIGRNIKRLKLSELPIDENSYQLDLSGIEDGIYIVSIIPTDSKKRISLKFIKKE
ncbi:MAG: T9SS type A sorting domain-containing protein [Bacteroidales bacterium]|nr:T9SS type A sorting domain-containing protein [Bacteroidales bacterium]